MKRVVWIALGVAAAVSSAEALRSGASSIGDGHRLRTRTEYAAAMAAIDASFAAQAAACDERAPSEREPCRAQAAAASLVRGAEAESGFRGNAQAARAAQRARIEARYIIERARCGS